mgnify:CR=1 FL=1
MGVFILVLFKKISMNELNLQNSSFREQIRWVDYDERGLVVCIRIKYPKTLETIRIFSANKPLDENQRWFTRTGLEINSRAELEMYLKKNYLP